MSNAIRDGGASMRPVLRIAIPVFLPRFVRPDRPAADPAGATRAEFKRLLDAALNQDHGIRDGLTRNERKELAAARRIRKALYGGRETTTR